MYKYLILSLVVGIFLCFTLTHVIQAEKDILVFELLQTLGRNHGTSMVNHAAAFSSTYATNLQ